MDLIYHIVQDGNWTKYQHKSYYEADSLQTEGFIHLSKKDQVPGVLERYYQGVPDLLLVHIDAGRLVGELKYEVSTNDEQFPHLYGPLNKDAVVAVERIS